MDETTLIMSIFTVIAALQTVLILVLVLLVMFYMYHRKKSMPTHEPDAAESTERAVQVYEEVSTITATPSIHFRVGEDAFELKDNSAYATN